MILVFIVCHDTAPALQDGALSRSPQLLASPVDEFLVQPVQTRPLGLDLLKVLLHLLAPFRLCRGRGKGSGQCGENQPGGIDHNASTS